MMEQKTIGQYKVYIVIIMLLCFFMIFEFRYVTVENLVEHVSDSIFLAIISFLLIYAVKAVVMIIPVPVLYVAAGIVFPLPWAIVVSYLGLIIALSVGYFNGRRLGEKKVTVLINKHIKLENVLKGKMRNLDHLCFLSRFIPLPFDLLSMFYGALKMPFDKYLTMSLLGVTPKVITFILTSTYISKPWSIEFMIPFILSLTVVLVGIFIHAKNNV